MTRFIPDNDPEGSVEKMGRCVVAPDLLATPSINRGVDGLAHPDESLGHGSPMNEDVRNGLVGVVDVDRGRWGADGSGVSKLTARLAIERRAVKNDLDWLAGLGFRECSFRADQRDDDRPVHSVMLITEELGLALGERDEQFRALPAGVLERSSSPTT